MIEYKKIVRYEKFDYQKEEGSFVSHLIAIAFGFVFFPFLYSTVIENWFMWWLSLIGIIILELAMFIKKRVVTYIKIK